MREQADRVEEALSRRIAETEESTRALEDELKAVSIELVSKELNHFGGIALFFRDWALLMRHLSVSNLRKMMQSPKVI